MTGNMVQIDGSDAAGGPGWQMFDDKLISIFLEISPQVFELLGASKNRN